MTFQYVLKRDVQIGCNFIVNDNPVPQTKSFTQIPVVIDSLRISHLDDKKVVVFFDETGKLYLPIWIGAKEGDVMLSELQNTPHEKCSTLISELTLLGKPKKFLFVI